MQRRHEVRVKEDDRRTARGLDDVSSDLTTKARKTKKRRLGRLKPAATLLRAAQTMTYLAIARSCRALGRVNSSTTPLKQGERTPMNVIIQKLNGLWVVSDPDPVLGDTKPSTGHCVRPPSLPRCQDYRTRLTVWWKVDLTNAGSEYCAAK
jgi:hypothetical protein